MFKKILVPIDGSDSAWRALTTAKELVDKFEGSLVIVTVTQPINSLKLIVDKHEADRSTVELTAVSEQILTLAKMKLTGCTKAVSYVIKAGHPAECIEDAAKENNCDCIVIGRRGLSGVAEFFLGSVSASVSQHAEIPVVIVK